jgi:glycine/D-amino acid oxidase-like deaminating enzyme
MRLKKDGLDEAGTRVAKVTRRTLAKVGIAAGCGSMAASIPLIGDWTSLPNESTFPKQMTNKPRVIVVGAGAFGGWTALHLLRGGASVTLIDTWGPGNSRSSSGGETRVIRGAYGPGQPYTRMAARSFELWREQERQWNEKLLHSIGVLWMAEDDDSFERASLPPLKEAGIPYEELPVEELKKRWPQINFERVRWGIYEPHSGYLLARASCQTLVEHFVAEGGTYRQLAVSLRDNEEAVGKGVDLSDGSKLIADHYVYACAPCQGKIFPITIGKNMMATRHDVIFLGTPAGDARYDEGNIPVWADHRDHFMYGIQGNQKRGFKIADDTRGPEFVPTSGDRVVDRDRLEEARRYVTFRFPGMKDAPLVETRVCPYENTPDRDYILDRHPNAANVWIAGGGSGHGFKNGPAVGEIMAGMILAGKSADRRFQIARFPKPAKS